MPPKALTTTTEGRLSPSTIRLRFRIPVAEPTDVPPNFNTFILIIKNELYEQFFKFKPQIYINL